MASALVGRFLEGDLSNGIFDEVKRLSEYITACIKIQFNISVIFRELMISFNMNFKILNQLFSNFMNNLVICGASVVNEETFSKHYGELHLNGRFDLVKAKNAISNNFKLIEKMLEFYQIPLTIDRLIHDYDINIKILDQFLMTDVYQNVRYKVDEIKKEKINEVKNANRLKSNFPDPNSKESLVRSISEMIDYSEAIVIVKSGLKPYVRIGYRFLYIDEEIRIRNNIKAFHMNSIFRGCFIDGMIPPYTVQCFETMLVYYATGRATINEDYVLIRDTSKVPIGSKVNTSMIARFSDVDKKDSGELLWKLLHNLKRCIRMSECEAKASFETEIVRLLGRLSMLNFSNGEFSKQIVLTYKSQRYTEFSITEAASRLSFSLFGLNDPEEVRKYCRNIISSVMLRVANEKIVKPEGQVSFNLFPVTPYGPSYIMRFDLRFAAFAVKALLLLLS